MPTPTFQALEWLTIDGRGRVAIVENDHERPRDASGLVGATVKIDGEFFICTGVDRFALATPIRAGEKIGLMVRQRQPGE